ncbi:MAG TPA: NADH-quinone oxidoreductase subunit H [Planctomycetota bacterium]|nr:NADH-quinone oxidoreductase subunit H [Planctomycetota bacterium]
MNAWAALHVALLLVGPIYFVGIVNRTKSIWGGRRGPRLDQLFHDLVRLLRKEPVYSETTSVLVRAGPLVALATAIVAAAIAPVVSGYSILSFPYDFVVFAYLLGLGRMFLMLAALDTGSAFEGMGASREATFASFIEPAFFLTLGSFAVLSGESSFVRILAPSGHLGAGVIFGFVALLIFLQIEAARIPVDDPNTHLELTMIHEVMILDHSGPDLAALQTAAALKMFTCAGILAAVLNPFGIETHPAAATVTSIALIAATGVGVGLVESLVARLRMSALPRYALVAVLASVVSVGLVVLRGGNA